MGNIHIPLGALIRALGAETVVPPPPDAESVARGLQAAPETMCIPFKITLSNMLRALEMGADTLCYGSGTWSCRYGYYFRLHADILRDHGFEFGTLVLHGDEIPRLAGHIIRLNQGRIGRSAVRAAQAFRIGWAKSTAVDEIERLARWFAPREREPGTANRLYRRTLEQLDRTDSVAEVKRRHAAARAGFRAIPTVPERNPLRVRIVGESYCLLEPYVNLNLFERLGAMGVWADPFLTTHRWLGFHSLRIGDSSRQRLLKPARNYWRYNTGGEDENAVAYTIEAAQQGYDGAIHLHPFTCMPGAVVGPVLQQVSRDYRIPLLDLALDEHTAEAGFYTRIEAFLSVLESRRRTQLAAASA
jgi:predicted nucleotide-binding protein (sugar kinase/HSP70/actin superfamily)